MRTFLRRFGPLIAVAAAVGVGWLIGAQSEHDSGGAHEMHEPAAAASDDRDIERGFLEAMVPHHESGIDMAEVALDHAGSAEIEKLARAIVTSQGAEIEQMRRIHERLFGEPLEPDEGAHAALGLSMEEAGMDHGGTEMMEELANAKPFDRAFVDHMVPHHQGAVEMSEVLLRRTDDAELKKLGRAIIDAQKREIAEMNAFRKREFGGPAPQRRPAGGGHEGMDMEGE